MSVQKTVFISYRRTNYYMAQSVYAKLRTNGYDAFLDYQSLDSGDFSQSLLTQIAARAHFVVILTPSALERCVSSDDWMRREIEYAIEQKRNVIPLLFEGFSFDDVKDYLVSDWLKMLPDYNGLRIPDDYFDEAMARLCGTRYLDRDVETVLHPVAAQAAKAALAAQKQVDEAPAPTPEQLEAEKLFESGFRKSRLLTDFDGAIEDFTRVISLRPNDTDAYHRRGRAFWNKGDTGKALHDLETALKLNPDDQHVHIIRSGIAHLEGNFKLALAEADAGVSLTPDYYEAYIQRGFVRAVTGDLSGAIADYSDVIRLNSQYALAYYNRGQARYNQRNFDQAIADYEAALQIDPNHALAKQNLENARQMKAKQ